MTVPRVNALVEYWQEKCPPACKSLAAFIGFKPKVTEAATGPAAQDQEKVLEEVMAMFPMRPPKPLPIVKPGDQNG